LLKLNTLLDLSHYSLLLELLVVNQLLEHGLLLLVALLLGFHELAVEDKLPLLELLLDQGNLLGIYSWLLRLLLLELLLHWLMWHRSLCGRHLSSDLGIMGIYVVLKHKVIGILLHEFLRSCRVNLTNSI
jgi:hypothetical protein